MHHVFVLDSNYQPLMPCHPARAKELLGKGKAAIYRRFPFTIILKYAVVADNQPIAFKVDPGSRQTGIALVAEGKCGKRVIFAAVVEHRGHVVSQKLLERRQLRRGRRHRKTRYRPARFDNRRRSEGWLPPSITSRVGNIQTWLKRLYRCAPIDRISLEFVKFDTQLMQHAEISGIEYQQGELEGYEIREYLLEKWERKCAYCGAENVRLEVDHILPKSGRGSNRVSNLCIACHDCNQRNGNQTADEFEHPEVQRKAKQPLQDTAAVNASRWALWHCLERTSLPLETGTGGRTKWNRTQQGYPKAHWIDAACVGESGAHIFIGSNITPLHIKATGRGSRQMCRMDRFGFPRTTAKRFKRVHGFQTGDLVRAIVPHGIHAGPVAVRASGSFRVGQVDGIAQRHCHLLYRSDGYEYTKGEVSPSSPRLQAWVSGECFR